MHEIIFFQAMKKVYVDIFLNLFIYIQISKDNLLIIITI